MHTSKLPYAIEVKNLLNPLSHWEKISIVAIPLLTIVTYFILASKQLWVLAFLSLCYLSFASYGSCCHDLVHANFGFSRTTCNRWLSLIEFFLMRSGTTYRLTHLIHHQHYPDFDKDPEGRASYYSLFRAFLEGPIFHPKLVWWSLKHANQSDRTAVLLEVFCVALFWFLGISLIKIFPQLIIYQILVMMGSWVIPFITSYLVHNPHETLEINQTKLFRGWFFRIIALDHLYHLEHHLYPQVPHCRWKELAKILNPYFENASLKAKRFGKWSRVEDSLNLELN